MNKCIVCGKDYESQRATSKYCSAKCRKLAFCQNGKVSVPGQTDEGLVLKAWARDKGTRYQQYLGTLARQYSVINGFLTVKDLDADKAVRQRRQ